MLAPTDASLFAASDAIIADLALTERDLLAALADHWEQLADLEMPIDGGCSLLAFARHVLLAPVVGACALIWSRLDVPAAGAPASDGEEVTISWDEWSPITNDDWGAAAGAELEQLGRPALRDAANADEAAEMLADARAACLGADDGPARVAESIVRASGWPGDTRIIDPVAAQAVDWALEYADDVDPETDNDELVDKIEHLLLPCDEVLVRWVRDPSFGTVSEHSGASRTGADVLHTAADWLVWSIARAAVEATAAAQRCTP